MHQLTDIGLSHDVSIRGYPKLRKRHFDSGQESGFRLIKIE